MLFNSYIFIFLFLPITLIGYFSFNHFSKTTLSKTWLLLMSLWFYGYFNVKYLPIILISILFNFAASKILLSDSRKSLRLIIFLVAISLNIGVLFYYKYLDFCIENINQIFNSDILLKKLVLPLGISFFTFQQLSYIIDSYKKSVPNYNFLDYSLFVTFFPQLIAGPIVLHDEIIPQFANSENLKFNYDNFSKGLYAFALGLSKKVLVADLFGKAVNLGFSDTDFFLNTTNGIIIMLSYTIQIYFDFSGYCDMSRGLGLMFNIDIPINFNSPYRAYTIMGFWKNWHITLTRFFTTYMYIPLGGNRKGKVKTYINNLLVFLTSGIWHGANWTFILWGFLHGIAIVVNKIFRIKIEKIPKAVLWILNFIFINFTWLLFRADNVKQFLFIVKNFLFFSFEKPSVEIMEQFYTSTGLYLKDLVDIDSLSLIYVPSLLFLAILASTVFKNTNERLKSFKPNIKNSIISVFLITWSIISFSQVSTFLYFNF